MEKIRQGDIVSRISYGHDILFVVSRVIKKRNQKALYLLKGLTMRIEADSPEEDLTIIHTDRVKKSMRQLDGRLQKRKEQFLANKKPKVGNSFLKNQNRSEEEWIHTGKILHLDGDKRYTEKSMRYYKELGLHAIVKNIAENKQPILVRSLLEKYKPDILIITGHDALIKGARNYEDVSNYRNSKYFAKTVQEARKWDKEKRLVIFAGACQSYFELLMSCGANFASSPARVLIDFADPLVIAEKVATTDKCEYITIEDLAKELRDGTKGVGGIGAKGKKEIILK